MASTSSPRQLVERDHPLVSHHVVIERAKPPLSDRLRARGVFQMVGVKNANNRVYPESVWNRNLSPDSPLQKRVRARLALGELEHPDTGITHLERVSHLVEKAWMEFLEEGNEYGVPAGKYVLGEYMVLDTPRGKILQELHACGVPIGISSRGRGDTHKEGDVDIVEDNYDCDTWDCVYQPSVDYAYPTPVVSEKSTHTSLLNRAKELVERVGGDLSGVDTLALVELGSHLASTSRALGSSPNLYKERLLESSKKVVKVLRERNLRGLVPNKVSPPNPKRGAIAMDKQVVDLVESLASELAVARAHPMGPPREGDLRKRLNVTTAIAEELLQRVRQRKVLEKRLTATTMLADSLLTRAREEKRLRLLRERRYGALKEITEELRLRCKGLPLKGPSTRGAKTTVRESRQPTTPPAVPATRLVDPAEGVRGVDVSVDKGKGGTTLIERLFQRGF